MIHLAEADAGDQLYRNTNMVSQDGGQAVWCVSFNFVTPEHRNIFATVCSNKATIYRCLPAGGLEVLQIYADDDTDEEFFVCKWTVDEASGAPLLLLAGKNSVLRVLDVMQEKLLWTARGHGDSINDIAVHPLRPSLVLTASRDQSLRLWNIKTRVIAAVMNGEGGHCNEVLSIDFHQSDPDRIVSGGMDANIKLWNLNDIRETLEASEAWQAGDRTFPTAYLTDPDFTTSKVHQGYVDCVRYFGEYVLSKSVDNRVVLWEPKQSPGTVAKGLIHFVREFALEDAHVWFVRFSMDFHCRLLACGTRHGRILVWDPNTVGMHPLCTLKRGSSPKMTVRQTALSYDGSILLAACDDGTIWRYDCVDRPTSGSGNERPASASNLHNTV